MGEQNIMSDERFEGIAIIGMAGRFPGAESVEEFWTNLVAGKETISFFSDAELMESGLDPAELKQHGRYVPARGLLKDADCFDAAFFGVHPKEAEVIDPQQRVFLEACWAALERAGYPPSNLPCSVGVFGGATYNTYYQYALAGRPDLIELVGSDLVMFGNEKDYLTTRVAYKLGLKGPALNVCTACSTSLVAVAQAYQSLLTYQSDIALAGGVSVKVPQKSGYYHDEGNIGSADGHTRSFDAQSSGTAFSNGVAVVVLKRMEDAVKDGDRIYAVIKSAVLNNDGSQRVSFGAPGIEGQSQVIAMAHAMAGVDPETITCVEAHGTATPLGDPIEVAALTKAFRMGTEGKQFCALGSVKSNIGHLDVAAGVAGLIKMALSLHHKMIPPSLHFTKPNPKLDLENSPFYVNAALQKWTTKPGVPRRAGISSFGTGGTNAHVVLEEAPELFSSGPSRPWQLLVLSAKTTEALDRATANLAEHLRRLSTQVGANEAVRELADAAYTLQSGRSEFVHRRIVACRDFVDAADTLEQKDPKRVFTQFQQFSEPPVVFMFSGQGAQYPGMGAALYRTEALFRAEVDRCAEFLRPILNDDLRRIMFPAAGTEKDADALLVQTKFTQPALFVLEYALAKLWICWGVKPTAMIGHSVGEYVAGCLAGVFSLEDALMLVARRGALVQAQPGGAMLAIRLSEKEVLPLLSTDTSIAAINSSNLCVASGPHDAIATLERELEAKGVKVRHLHTSHAFHSPMMEPVLEPFTALLKTVKLSAPMIPYVSNVSGQWITETEAQSPGYWAGHVRQSVRFAEGVGRLMKDHRHVLLEVGPGQTLCTLARQHPDKKAEQAVFASLPLAGDQELRGITETLGRVWMTGVQVDWLGYYAEEQRRRAILPTYPFERKRYWPEPLERAGKVSMPGVALPTPASGEVVSVTASPVPSAAAVAQKPAEPAMPRQERLLVEVRTLMQELSGYDLTDIDPSTDLLELGLDSLLLTQAAQLIQRKFGAQISFRQLMEDLSSLSAIAAHLDQVLPASAFAQEPAGQSPVVQPAAGTVTAGAPIPQPILEQILQQQQQLTNQILQLMGRKPTGTLPAAAPIITMPTPPAAVAPIQGKSDGKSHGPFKPFDKHVSTSLTEEQKRALNELIERYTRKTGGSKKLAGENRTTLADPRSVAGFNRLWKEMVYPIVSARSDGSKVWDVDGNEYVDFVMGFGANFFGHRPAFVVQAVREQLDRGFEIGPIQTVAYEVAALIKEFTGMERVAFTNTGSEAVLAAMRVTRTISGRDKIAVFAGAYHGIFDEVLFRPLTVNGKMRTAAIAPGVPASALSQVIVLDYGNPQSIEILRARGSEIAAVFVEPVQARRLDLQPKEFLLQLREVTQETGTALVFDEVVTGFRVHPGGAQALFGIRADLATYGKVVGGGLPIGVVTGSAKYMDALDGGNWQYGDTSFPEVGVTFFAGTCVRHPLALASAKSVLTYLKQQGPGLQERLAERTAKLAADLRALIEEFHAPYHIAQFNSLMTLTFTPDQKLAGLLFYLLRARGILIWENRNFIITTAHSESDFSKLVTVFRECLAEMQASGFITGSAGEGEAMVRKEGTTQESSAAKIFVSKLSANRFPLTEAQKEIWLAAQMGGEASVAYNESLTLKLNGPFDVETFKEAVGEVIRRHPILLASISEDGEWQRIPTDLDLEIPLEDVSALSQSERDRYVTEAVHQEATGHFDLLIGPLLRIRVIRLSNDYHVVLWTAHHIVCDGWSCGVLISETAKIYSAHQHEVEPKLDAPVPYQSYVQEAQPGSYLAQEALAYWREQFSVVPLPLDLPTDRPRPAVRSAKAATVTRRFDGALYQSLKRVAGQQRTTMVVLLMAALKTFLHRLTGQTDLVIGLPVAGQAVTGNHCLVGHCVNLLPIRVRLQPESGFLDNLAAVKKQVLDAYDHHQCTIGTILQHVTVPRHANRPPLVEVMFNVDRDLSGTEFSGLSVVCERNHKPALHYDFFFNFTEGPKGLSVDCDYNTDLFDETTIHRWFDRYEILLKSIASKPAEALDAMPVLPDGERRELLALGSPSDTEFPSRTVAEWFEDLADTNPEARAVVCEEMQLTYGELNRRVNQLARHLRTLGIGPNDLVGLMVERSMDMVIALLGVMKSGGAYVPLDPSFPAERLTFMVENSRMRALITHRDLDRLLSVKPSAIVRLDADGPGIAKQAADNLPQDVGSADRLAYVLYTSGSTGKPKGVEIMHSALVNFLDSMRQEPGFTHADTMLAVTTLSFDIAGLELYLPLVTGGTLVIASREEAQDPVRLMERMRECRCTMMQATPSTWRGLIQVGWSGSPGLKILCGGEAFPRDLAEELLPRCAELWNMYGPTETTIWSTVHRIVDASGPIAIGRPIANTQVFVLDGHRSLMPRGVIGELYVGGKGVARGYLHRPDLTEERFIQNPFARNGRFYRTGDLARWLPDGTLECLGRIDSQVKIRGYRIELGEIETVLSHHRGIRQAVAAAYDESPGSKVLVAYIETNDGTVPDVSDLRAHLKKSLPDYMVPSIFVPMDKLPLTPNGKIDRKALPPPHERRVEIAREFVAPRDPLEQSLAAIWSRLLKMTEIGVHDNYFELGGHSLGAISMLADVRKLTGKILPLATLFQAPTIATLAELLRNEGWSPSWSSLVPIKLRGSNTPIFLVHGAEGNVLLYRQLSQYVEGGHPIYGLQSNGLDGKGTLDRTIEKMASRYVKEITALHPHGPYIVGGYCMGGTVALEMAQQLTAMGERVSLVILLETYNPAMMSRAKARLLAPLHFAQNLWFHGANVLLLDARGRRKFLAEKTSVMRARFKMRFQLAGLLSPDEQHTIYPHVRIKHLNDQAQFDYRPHSYRGRVVVFRTKGAFAGEVDPHLGWSKYVQDGLHIHELPLYPRGMLVEPFCRKLAETLNHCLHNI